MLAWGDIDIAPETVYVESYEYEPAGLVVGSGALGL